MSSLVFPSTLPGFRVISRTPVVSNQTVETIGGKRFSFTWWSAPQWQYSVTFDMVRDYTSVSELDTVAGFFARHFGSLDSFLFTDPDDCTLTVQHPFGRGDGTTTTFQLQRTLVPSTLWVSPSTPALWPLYTDGFEPVYEPNGTPTIYCSGDWRGLRQLFNTSRTNRVLYSVCNGAAWTATACTLTAGQAGAPDGTATATKLMEDATSAIHRSAQGSLTLTNGTTYTVSVYAKASTGTRYLYVNAQALLGTTAVFNLQSGTVTQGTGSGANVSNVGSGWYRCSVRGTGTGAAQSLFLQLNNTLAAADQTYLGDGASAVLVWGCQIETGSSVTSYIPTTSSTASVTDWTLGTNGSVTFATAPASGTSLTWTGNYYKRVRFADDQMPLSWIASQIYATGEIKLLSVKP